MTEHRSEVANRVLRVWTESAEVNVNKQSISKKQQIHVDTDSAYYSGTTCRTHIASHRKHFGVTYTMFVHAARNKSLFACHGSSIKRQSSDSIPVSVEAGFLKTKPSYIKKSHFQKLWVFSFNLCNASKWTWQPSAGRNAQHFANPTEKQLTLERCYMRIPSNSDI